MRENEVVREYRAIRREYAYNPDIMTEDTGRVAALKYIINHLLPTVDRTIILLYADCGSYRKLGKKLGLSHMTVRKECLRIRERILKEYEHLHSIDTDGCGHGFRG